MTYASGNDGLAAARLPEAERMSRAVAQLERIYPGSARLFARGRTVAWSNSRLNGGAYSAFAPGQVADFWTALRRSYGRIHLAGEHTANFTGYMEGALRSGLSAARRSTAPGAADQA